MALTKVPLWIFFVCCLVGDLPYTFLWAYVGSRGQSLTEVLNGDVQKTPAQSALSLLGVLVLVVLVKAVKTAVDEAVQETKAAQGEKESEMAAAAAAAEAMVLGMASEGKEQEDVGAGEDGLPMV